MFIMYGSWLEKPKKLDPLDKSPLVAFVVRSMSLDQTFKNHPDSYMI